MNSISLRSAKGRHADVTDDKSCFMNIDALMCTAKPHTVAIDNRPVLAKGLATVTGSHYDLKVGAEAGIDEQAAF